MKGKSAIATLIVTMIAQSILANAPNTGKIFPENGPVRTPVQWVLRVVFGR